MTLSQVQFIKSLIKVDELSLDERLKAENILEEYEKSFKGEKTMKIEVKIRKLFNEKRLKAVCSITIENQLAIHDIKVVQGDEKLFIAMPSRKNENGEYQDVCHPINEEFRSEITQIVLEAFSKAEEEKKNAE